MLQSTIIIAVKNAMYFNNYLTCPPSFETRSGIRVIVHTDPAEVTSASTIYKNYDILINANANNSNMTEDIINIVRLGKVQQATTLTNVYKKLDESIRIKNVMTWGFRENFISAPAPTSLGINKLVVKPAHGARGIFQSVFNPTKISVASVFSWYKKSKDFDDWISSKPEYVEISGIDKPTGIDKGMFRDVVEELVLQEYVEDIMTEYRVVFRYNPKDNSFIAYCQTRAIEGTETFKQAIGSKESPETCGLLKTGPLYDFVHGVLQHLNTPFGSIDVFQTIDHKWGIFEYQGQHGVLGLGDVGSQMFKGYLEDVVEHYVDNKIKEKDYDSV